MVINKRRALRGKRKSKKSFVKSLRFLGVNSAGLKPKLMTFKKVVNDLKPAVFFVEETKYKDVGKLKMDNYVIFELVRQSRDGGGGLALGCVKELQPVWVREGDDQVEALSVNIFIKQMKIRCCVAYGCQESDSVNRKEAFWKYLDEEIFEANHSESAFILHFDGNLWAGENIIPGDPRPQNRNGKFFKEFLDRHPHLSVVNGLSLCEGLITRSRFRDGKWERSVLDFFVICSRLLPYLKKMVIDERKDYILTNYQNVGVSGKAVDSDHFTEYMDLDLKVESAKPERNEIYNFKEKEGQIKFKQITSNTSEFTDCFKNEKPLLEQVENWENVLKTACKKAFKKIRIKSRQRMPQKGEVNNLINERNKLINKSDEPDNRKRIETIDELISKVEAEENRNKIVNQFKHLNDSSENVNINQVWKQLKKLWPKTGVCLPTAKKNHRGKLVSGASELKILLAKEYKERLRSRPVRPDLIGMQSIRKRIFEIKMILSKRKASKKWKMSDLELALAQLKNNKSRDNDGFINEIFKRNVIGDNLKISLLLMFNKLKKKKLIPKLMNVSNITTVPKKGSRLLLKNERGIFRVSVLRSILMRMIYNEKYPTIDRNMSDCQMGGRKEKGCNNNIFLINGIIHEVMKSKKMKSIVLQFYDYAQMFDSINLEYAISDIYDVGLDDDNLALIYNANKDINMAVKTPAGLSARQSIKDIVLQGDTWGSILASVQVDKIGKDCMEEGHYYLYKGVLPVGFLGLVDDIVGITESGFKAQQLNSFINVKTAEKTLQFGPAKCKSMLVGKDTNNVFNSEMHVDKWVVDHIDNSKTGEADLVEYFSGKVSIGQTDEQTYLGFVISNKGENMANIRKVKQKSIGTVTQIINKLNSLNLRNYYFECAVLLLNVILRGSILYACEVYYDLKENELRQIERIEENFLRQIFKTSKGCPITQLYLEVGQIPARFEIQKRRLLYLKYLLQQDEKSILFKFIILQIQQPSKGDFVTTCKSDLDFLTITESFDEIKLMTKKKFSKILKQRTRQNALKYLIEKQNKKGKEIQYSDMRMSEYLLPSNQELTINGKRKLFAVRNGMIDIPSNFPNTNVKPICICGQTENLIHIYNCKLLGKTKKEEFFEKIFTGSIRQQLKVFNQLEENLEKREQILASQNLPCDPSDPLYSSDYSNG